MDRNVFVAIALSMSVLLFWGAFFETPKKTSQQQINQKVEQKSDQNTVAPTISQPQIIKKITREESINTSKRIKKHLLSTGLGFSRKTFERNCRPQNFESQK